MAAGSLSDRGSEKALEKLDGKWIRHKTLADGDGECNYWILGDKDPDALADVRSK